MLGVDIVVVVSLALAVVFETDSTVDSVGVVVAPLVLGAVMGLMVVLLFPLCSWTQLWFVC